VEEALREREGRLRLLLDAEEESRSLREQLARVGRISMMGELSASIAHEVNQPLCAIVSNAQTAQRMLAGEGYDVEELLEALRDISEDAQRANSVISRIHGLLQNEPVQRVVLDMNELIREMTALLGTAMGRRGVTVRLELGENIPSVQGDRVQLQQVILNLMTNAADAMEGNPEGFHFLGLRSLLDGRGNVTVEVQDSGIGLDPWNGDRIFEPFFTTKRGGTGMGLTICKSIVEAHGGKIAAFSNDGGGATIQFTLPAHEGGERKENAS
jgi:C4-dicarboxylate-specific signal transduction histidine kinase